MLAVNDIKALPYHAGMDGATRSANQDAFLMEQVDVIVATIAFGMGIDKPDVRFVIHYDMPSRSKATIRRPAAPAVTGEGQCLTFYAAKDLQKMEKFMQGKPVAEQESAASSCKLETQNYAEASSCRRRSLLFYFGEEFTVDNCQNCDNCLNQETSGSERRFMCGLETVVARRKFKADHGHRCAPRKALLLMSHHISTTSSTCSAAKEG